LAKKRELDKQRKEDKEFRVETRKLKQKIKTYAQKMSDIQPIFNELRRLEEFKWFKERGIEPYCISCQKPLGNDVWACGHFKTRKAKPELRFDRNNTFLQHNVKCNMHDSGDIEGYKKGLINRFGEVEGKAIISYCESHHDMHKYTDDEIAELKANWRKQIRKLKRELS